MPSLEDRVAALEKVLAQQLYGGEEVEALQQWQANHLPPDQPDPEPEPEPEPKHHRSLLHPTHKKR